MFSYLRKPEVVTSTPSIGMGPRSSGESEYAEGDVSTENALRLYAIVSGW